MRIADRLAEIDLIRGQIKQDTNPTHLTALPPAPPGRRKRRAASVMPPGPA